MGAFWEGQRWRHAGGKLREIGASKLEEAELLAILISTGVKGRSAEAIAQDVLKRYGSLNGMANLPLERLLEFKGLGDVKIAAAFEIARRVAAERRDEPETKEQQT